MAWNTSSGCTISIGTQAAASNLTEFEADTYTEIGEINNIGDFGKQFETVTATPLSTNGVLKRKGTFDLGDMSIEVLLDSDDSGQSNVETARDDTSADAFNFKVELNDQPSGGTNPTTYYFKAFVTQWQVSIGGANSAVTGSGTLALTNDAPLTKKSAA